MEDISGSNQTSYSCLNVDWKFGYEKTVYWVSGVILSIVSFFGLLGNILNIIVLCQQKLRKNNFYNLLLALTCFDILFILSYGVNAAYESMACIPFNEVVH